MSKRKFRAEQGARRIAAQFGEGQRDQGDADDHRDGLEDAAKKEHPHGR